MKQIRNFPPFLIFLLGLFSVLLLSSGFYSLAETSEARYAEIAREMLMSGDYMHPQLLGIYHYHKPPITYWITALGYTLFGMNEFAARFFLQVALICQVWLLFQTSKLLFQDKRTAFFSVITYLTLPIVLVSTRNLTTDAYMTTFVMAACYFFLLHVKKNKLYGLYGFYIMTALAFLTKGPVPLIFIVVFTVLYKRFSKSPWRFTFHHLLSLLLCLALSGSWYALVIFEKPELLNYFVFHQVADRISSESYDRSKPFWFYIPIIVGMLLPWLLFVGIGSKRLWKAFKIKKIDQFLLYTCLGIIVIFSAFKTKLLMYLLPMFWIFALAVGHQLSFLPKQHLKLLAKIFCVISILVVLSPVLLGILPLNNLKSNWVDWFLLIPTSVLVWIFMIRYQQQSSRMFVSMSMLFFCVLLFVSQRFLLKHPWVSNSVTPMITKIHELSKNHEDDSTILVYNYLLSSVPFYTDLPTITLQFDHNTVERDVSFQDNDAWKHELMDLRHPETLNQVVTLASKKYRYMLVRKKRQIPEPIKVLREAFSHRIDYPKWILYYN